MELYGDFLVFSTDYRKNIIFLPITNVKSSWTFEIDWSLKPSDAKPRMFLESGSEENSKSKDTENQEEALVVHNIAVSRKADLLAFTASDKTIFLCQIKSSSAVILSRRLFLRASSQLRFSSCGKLLFLSDKTGDTFEYSCENFEQPGRWIFGHISQILDLKVKDDLRYIVTSDRDEKIRVTNYPDTHEIEAFCVGHNEYVSSVAFFNDDSLLLSASGDKSLRLWDYKTGKQVHQIEMEFVPVTINFCNDLLAISSDKNTLYIYKYETTSPDTLTIHLITQKTYLSEFDFICGHEAVYIKYLDEVDGVKKLKIDKATSSSVEFELLHNISETIGVELEPSFKIFRPFDISLLFKKKFDNVKPYIERKNARIESRGSKKKKIAA